MQRRLGWEFNDELCFYGTGEPTHECTVRKDHQTIPWQAAGEKVMHTNIYSMKSLSLRKAYNDTSS